MEKKILFISGNLIKHKFLTIKLLKKFKPMKIIFEKYPKKIETNYVKRNSKIIRRHFKNVKKYENKYFGVYVKKNIMFLKKNTLFNINKGSINNQKVINEIVKFNPNLIIINATSILSKNFLLNFKNKIINFHAGLLPYYRGAGCNVWPFYYDELEYVGVSTHFVDAGVDIGNIILQNRPKFSVVDNTHSIGCKNTILGVNLLNRSIKYILRKPKFKGVKIKSDFNRLCLKKNFNSKVIKQIEENLSNKIISKYLKNEKKINISRSFL